MNALIKTGRIFTALAIAGLGILCLLAKDFIVGRPPAWPPNVNVNPILAYVTAVSLLICSLSILFRKKGGITSLVVALLILVLSITRHLYNFVDWLNALKALALLGGMLVVACSFFKEDSRLNATLHINTSTRKTLVLIGCIALGIFFVAAGYAHFKFADFVNNFIPAYIPFRPFWTYFTGICLVAGGIGVVIPPVRKWAALLSGIMVFGWFLLLHIPRLITNMNDPGEHLGVFESLLFAGIFFVLAGISKTSDR
jgi:uncharacterized membrane protein YphA (DoxX/SURF4 family)